MEYTTGTAEVRDSPPQNRLRPWNELRNRSGRGDLDQSSQSIPHFNLLDSTAEDRKRRRLALGFSPAFEALAICLVLWALMAMPHQPELKLERQQALMFRLATPPPPAKHVPSLVKQPPSVRLSPAPVVPAMRHTETPKPELEHLRAPKISEPETQLPKPVPAPATFAAVRTPSRPARPRIIPVHTGNFSLGSGAAPTISKRPLREVQTGGFGASNGIPGNAEAGSHTQVARLGSFDLPEGPGHGNGTGGAKGVPGTVASAGFGNAVGSARGKPSPGNVEQSGFGNTVGGRPGGSATGHVSQGGFGAAVAGKKTTHTHSAAAAFKPVEILSKPNPVYPPEARRLHIEGDVILSVVFEASGKLDILGVVKGLGHGMNQAAIQAAENIRFKPAERDGRPVDSKATLHIIFQLAY